MEHLEIGHGLLEAEAALLTLRRLGAQPGRALRAHETCPIYRYSGPRLTDLSTPESDSNEGSGANNKARGLNGGKVQI